MAGAQAPPTDWRLCGFETLSMRSHGYVEMGKGAYILTLIVPGGGTDVLHQSGRIGTEKAEARRRSENNDWFNHIAFASILARKPAG